MKSLRSLIGIVLAFALAAFAVPGIAGTTAKTVFAQCR